MNDATHHDHDDHPERAARNSRNGMILFFAYLLLYGGFIALATFRPGSMSARPFGGTNLAILYGLGLIVAALLLAAIYMYLCRNTDQKQQ